MRDLIILVPDIDTEQALLGLLSRTEALGIRAISCDIFPHPRRDPGCLRESVEFLRGFTRNYEHAIVLFDHEGCGKESTDSSELEDSMRLKLSSSGWNDRAEPLILEPELEIWIWSDSPEVDKALGWAHPALREWLKSGGWLKPGEFKPARPKEAMREAMRIVRKVPSAAVYNQIAKTVSFKRCQDAKFLRLLELLRNWFPQP